MKNIKELSSKDYKKNIKRLQKEHQKTTKRTLKDYKRGKSS